MAISDLLPFSLYNARCQHGVTFVRLGYMPSVTPESSNLPIVMVPMRTIPKILLKAASEHGPPVKIDIVQVMT